MAFGDRGGVVGNRVSSRPKKKSKRPVPRGIDRVEENRLDTPLRARPTQGRAGSGVPEKRRTAAWYEMNEGGRRPHPGKPALQKYIERKGAKGALRGLTYGVVGEDIARTFHRHVAPQIPGVGPLTSLAADRLELDDKKPIDPKDLLLEGGLWLPPARITGGVARGAKAAATGKGALETARAAKAGYRAPIRDFVRGRQLRKFEKTLGPEARQSREEIHGLIDQTIPDHNERVATKELYDSAAESMGRHTGGSADDFYTKFAGATMERPTLAPAGLPDEIGALYQGVMAEAPPMPARIPARRIAKKILKEGHKLPPELRSEGVLAEAIDRLYRLTLEGAQYRDWYTRAANVTADAAERLGVDRALFPRLMAIYSQNANPTENFRRTLVAAAEFADKGHITFGPFKGQADKANKLLKEGDWRPPNADKKTISFYANILEDIDQGEHAARFGDESHVTVDLHATNTLAPGMKGNPGVYYDGLAQPFREIANLLGWKPKEVQAAAWVPQKALGMAEKETAKAAKRGDLTPKDYTRYIESASDAYERAAARYKGTLYQSAWADNPPGMAPPRGGAPRDVADLRRIAGETAPEGAVSLEAQQAVSNGVLDTLQGSGGHTWNSDLTSDLGKTGHAVSVAGHEKVIPANAFNESVVMAYKAERQQLLAADPTLKIGSWRDGDEVYLDLTRIIGDREAALRFGQFNGQKAIYDRGSGEVIDVDPKTLYQGFGEDAARALEEYSALARDIAKTLPEEEWPRWVTNNLRKQAVGDERPGANFWATYDDSPGNEIFPPEWLDQAGPDGAKGAESVKGAVSFQEDGRVLLHAFASADVSTFVHEVGHVLRRYALNDHEEEIVAKWAGAVRRDDGAFDWSVEAEEKFARGFEQYLREGVAPTKGLKKVFRTMRDALTRIYANTELPEISDDVRRVFDGLVSKDVRRAGPGNKIADALPEAKRLRTQQEFGYSEERARRVAAGEDAMAIGGEEGYRAALVELKGELPKLKFGALEGEFDQQTVDDLLTIIQMRDDLRFFERIRTQRALLNVLEGTVPTRSQIAQLEHVFGPELAQQLADSVPVWAKAKHVGIELVNVPRALMASIDLSAPFRQGLVLGARHPKMFAREWKPMLKSFAKEGAYDNVMEDIASRPTFEAMQKAGLAITDLENLAVREEQFISNYAELLTGGMKSPVRMSGRAYMAFLNKFRADAFDNYLQTAAAAGRDITDEKLLKDIARWVNTSTGRGSLGKHFEGSAVALNTALFSPRLIASRVQLLNPVFYAKLDPFVRRQALQGMGQLLAGVATTLYMAKLAGASVGLDPRSSDFGKIRVGDTRIDIAGGLQQYVVLYSRLIKNEMVSSSSGEVLPLAGGFAGSSRASILGRFAEQKLSPVGAYIWGAMKNENFEGDEFDPAKEAGKSLIPLGMQNTYDAYEEYGAGPAAVSGALGTVGFGSQTYPDSRPKPKREPQTPDQEAETWIAKQEKAFGVELPPEVKQARRDKALYQNLQDKLKDQIDVRSLTDKQRTALKIAVLTHGQTPPWLATLKQDLKGGDEETVRAIDSWVEKELGWNELDQISEAAGRVKVGTP